MKYFILVTSLLYQVQAFSSLEDVVLEVNFLNQSLNAKTQRSCQITSKENEPIALIRAQDEHKNLFSCSDVKDFEYLRALIAWKYCRPRLGDSAQACLESDASIIKQRRNSPEVMQEIKSFTQETFEKYKIKLADKCCDPNQKNCLNRFSKLTLSIKDSDKSDASYVSDSSPVDFRWNEIEITTTKLAKEYTKEGIERILLHEFGHVCQFGLISEDEEFYKVFTGPKTRCLPETGQKSFQVSNLKTLPCVQDKLEKLREDENNSSKYCYGKWYREAFADMIFRDEMNTPYHWVYDMHRTSPSKNYASVFSYIQCDMEHFPMDKTCN